MANSKVIIVTGASSGFGALTARHLALAGHIVYAGFRQPEHDRSTPYEEAKLFAKENNCNLRGIELNVTSNDSISRAVTAIMQKPEARIDVVVHNAGHMVFGPAEAFTPEQLVEMYEINCVSCQRVNRAVLPHMRQAGKGLLVWVSSSSARGPSSPFLAPYFAAKAAQDSLAQTYAPELSLWGIESSIVVPGIFTSGTNHFAHSGKPADGKVSKAYFEGPYKGWDEITLEGSASLTPPDADAADVARAVCSIVSRPHGTRPFQVHVEPDDGGATSVTAVGDVVRERYLRRLGCEELLHVKV
jgi:NAD(P)-dependent dehydrogenase (short-subunit alcohol dehydrogenase family)